MSAVIEGTIGFIAFVVVIFVLSGIRVLREWERMPVLRLGRYVGLKGPGIIYLIPLIDRAPMKISTRLDTIQFRTESTLTKDNVPVNVDSVLYMRPVDLEKAVLQVENYLQASQLASQTTLREVIGKVSLNELLAEREKVGARLREIIDEKTEAWGIKVTAVEVRDVIIPSNLQDAMSRQAQAERERMARVTLATAEFEASQKMIEAAKAYEASPTGLRLRWMNILYELGQQSQTNTIMLVPAVMPEAGWPPVGVYGFKDLTMAQQEVAKKRPMAKIEPPPQQPPEQPE
ncbi:MAG: SPFH domain-containing protein [Candidatus Bathyarchaeia archaeon]|jgi:regulator of protease activity HflC (stomatin/prohibitin superfamily)